MGLIALILSQLASRKQGGPEATNAGQPTGPDSDNKSSSGNSRNVAQTRGCANGSCSGGTTGGNRASFTCPGCGCC
ncbi:MAG: hypothetical protein RLZZ361_332 [Cyanobacteriota bacterium]